MKKALRIGFIIPLAVLLLFSAKTTFAQFDFTVEGPVSITGSTFDITVGNFNNAGRQEAIITHAQNYNSTTPSSSNIVSYMKYNIVSSTWESTVIENTGGYASLSITSGDYDSDGNRDFAFTSNCNCGNYYLYQGNGSDGFTNMTPTFSGNRFSYDMATGDFNNDGKTDILTGGNTMLSKFSNTSSGANNFSFNQASFVIASSDNSSYGYSIADFNGDGFKDIVASVPAEAVVRVLLNDGTGAFNSAIYTDYAIAGTSMSNIRGVATGDFNDDGYSDIVATSYNGNAIGILLNSANGTGTFVPVVLYTVSTPKWVEVGDINADGFLDIAVVSNNSIEMFSGNGDGTFASTPYSYSFAGASRLAISDIDNDGRADIAAVNYNSFIVLINNSGNYDIAVTDSVCSGDSYTFPDGSTQNNITTQVIQVSHLFTVVNSYDSTITTTVNVNPLYDLTENFTVCSGDSYTFPDGTTQNNITAQVVYTSNLQTAICLCDSAITTTIDVTTVDVTVSQNGITLTANATGAVYQWLDCDDGLSSITGETDQDFTAIANGNYAVEVEQNACIDTSICYAITTIGILESDFGSDFIVYPNPTSGIVSMSLGQSYDDVTVIVRNSAGIEISLLHFTSTDIIKLEIEGDAGYYLVEILTKSGKTARINVLKM